MGVALGAQDLKPVKVVGVIRANVNVLCRYGASEAWPTAIRIELVGRTEYCVATANATVDSKLMVVPITVMKGELGGLVSGDGE